MNQVKEPSATTISKCLAEATGQRVEALDLQLLLLQALGKTRDQRAWLLAHGDASIPAELREKFRDLVTRRRAGEPLAYISGHKEFFGIDLRVDDRVLIPRPDTETLVEWALELTAPSTGADVLDLGTGSGAIALAIKERRPDLRVQAIDSSPGALELARQNADRLGLQVRFQQGHWLRDIQEKFDLLLANPPYVRAGDPHLHDLSWEPIEALVAGTDGLDDLREIVQTAPRCLNPGAWLLLEHGHDQAEQVRDLLTAQDFLQVQSRLDLAGIERCSGGCQPG